MSFINEKLSKSNTQLNRTLEDKIKELDACKQSNFKILGHKFVAVNSVHKQQQPSKGGKSRKTKQRNTITHITRKKHKRNVRKETVLKRTVGSL